MNKKLLEIATQSNQGCRTFYTQDWQYNCAAWTGDELQAFADGIVEQCVNMLLEASAEAEENGKRANSRLLLNMAEQISELFEEPETEQQ